MVQPRGRTDLRSHWNARVKRDNFTQRLAFKKPLKRKFVTAKWFSKGFFGFMGVMFNH